ncbi:MAG: preprotein translocase subunit SecY [Lachnospiraceae bacterium]|nr:preprotein translocase subunit SecY [Lachnospiraceae bacterium]
MLQTLRNAFKIKELRSKILFTLAMLAVIRLGSTIPAPGINRAAFDQWFNSLIAGSDFGGIMNMFTGGSFENFSVLALNISPYITSSIIIQLLTIAIPKLEEMQRDGEDGRKKLTQWTRIVTVVLAIVEATAMSVGFYRQGILVAQDWRYCVTIVAALTCGSAFLMWIGERITENGIGNGISVVLAYNIIARMPSDIGNLFDQFIAGKPIARAVVAAVIIIAIIIGMIILVILLNNAERKIPVQYSQKIQGRKLVGGASSEIPLKVNTAGVMPIIFGMSLFQFPSVITQLFNINTSGTWGEILKYLSQSNWCVPSQIKYTLGMLLYIGLLVFFAYFYTSITFNPLEIADNMKRQGGFIPGIRPGKPTSDYLNGILNYIIFIGAIGLIIVGVLPFVFNGVFGASVSFGGTSLIIVVSVIIETLRAVESQMTVRNYKGFLED